MKWRESDPEEELIKAVARYLEIVEAGGDANAYLRSLGPLANEVRAIAGIESALRVELPGPTQVELARGRNQLYKAITTERGRRATGPRLIGIVGAAGLGLALGAGFASGAVPSEPLVAIVETIPFMNLDEPETQAGSPVGVAGAADEGRSAVPISAATVGPDGIEAEAAADARPETPASQNGRGIGADGTPPGQGGENPGNGGGNGNGNGQGSTPPGQGGENPGQGGGIGSGGTPPGQGGDNPGQGGGVGSGGTPPGQGGGVGSDGTPPGQGGDNPGNGNGNNGNGNGNGVGPDGTPPGQGGDNPGNGGGNGNGNNGNGNGNGVGPDGTPPGQGGDNPGNGGGNGNGNNGNANGNGNGVGPDGTPPGQGGDNPGNGNGGGNGNGNNGNGNGNGGSN